MLKVMKYDWRSGWRNVKATLLAAVIVSVLVGAMAGLMGGEVVADGRMFGITGDEFPSSVLGTIFGFLAVVWFAVMVALLVMTVDTIFRNLVTRMFGAEGYLTHTLPVDTWQLLLGKALGTWIFGVFMVFVAFAGIMLIMASTVVSSGAIPKLIDAAIALLPKLGAYHFKSMVTGLGYGLYGIAAFLAWSFLMVVQMQFICIAARQFGRFHVAGGFIVFWLLCTVEGNLNKMFSMGFVVFLLSSAACFAGSWALLKKRLSF